ncbi:GD14110 [Drosophila simulans]|uniref:GD14110 n=1 Tax=Drosophila simulans TaxID=7240 RepID=B4NVQ3_DROSI|nr:GD14110 [Drosophila simulans]
MPVDAALKRRISVLGKLDGGRKRSGLGPLGSGATRNGSTTAINGQQPSEMRHRFQTLGDRIKQFEYIQFADGPVATYAFNRSQQRPINTSIRDSPRSRIEKSSDMSINGTTNTTRSNAMTRRMEVRQQPRQLSFHNVLHANYRQRSRSLESGAVQLRESLESIARPATPRGPRGFDGATRGSSLDSSSRTSFRPSNSTITWDNSLGRYEANPHMLLRSAAKKDSEQSDQSAVDGPHPMIAKNSELSALVSQPVIPPVSISLPPQGNIESRLPAQVGASEIQSAAPKPLAVVH